MSRFPVFLACLAVLAFALSLSGCGAPSATAPAEQGSDAGHAAADHADRDQADQPQTEQASSGMAMPGMEDGLANLSPEDQEAARKQGVCPVTGEKLGSMGTPYKVTIDGRDVFLCCQGCEAKIKANPEKYLK